MYKVVYNTCYGGFSLSESAVAELDQRGKYTDLYGVNFPRHDPDLVAVVELLGTDADGFMAKLAVTTVSGKYYIQEYDGTETVIEPHQIPWIDPTEEPQL